LKIDMGKKTTITKIGVQRGSYFNWVTGYNLYYSQDGDHYEAFKDSGSPTWKVNIINI